MNPLANEVFVCLDCETTGLDPLNDKIIEVAAVQFTFSEIITSMDTLINPQCAIPPLSTTIHNISDDMVIGKPSVQEILPKLFDFVGNKIIVGHAINLDISFIYEEAKRHKIPNHIKNNPTIDTLRLARLYGETRENSLEKLKRHFNIEGEGAHRAMNDVMVNIEVFKFLSAPYKSSSQIISRLKSPVPLKLMPLGKHKGRAFGEIPIEYLYWAVKQDFDQDLIFSLQNEIKRRRKGNLFQQSSNPFSSL